MKNFIADWCLCGGQFAGMSVSLLDFQGAAQIETMTFVSALGSCVIFLIHLWPHVMAMQQSSTSPLARFLSFQVTILVTRNSPRSYKC